MSELKTKPNTASVKDFLDKVEPEAKRQDSHQLLEIFEKVTGEEAVMWGSSIIGFGKYHYKSQRSSQEGDWMLVGFSPRKQNLTLYLMIDKDQLKSLLDKLGKHKTSVGCLYINKLADIDLKVLEEIIKRAYQIMKSTNPVAA